jgi:preprotein translocase subunit SecA
MLRKVDSLSRLAPDEIQLVMFAIDERLRLHGLDPVFESESDVEEEAEPEPVVAAKPGRNDPCPCGSGKKYNKCCGA